MTPRRIPESKAAMVALDIGPNRPIRPGAVPFPSPDQASQLVGPASPVRNGIPGRWRPIRAPFASAPFSSSEKANSADPPSTVWRLGPGLIVEPIPRGPPQGASYRQLRALAGKERPYPGTWRLPETCFVEIFDPTGPIHEPKPKPTGDGGPGNAPRGARPPSREATAKLRDFVDSIGAILPPTARLADASGALTALVNKLESEGAATDDTWEYAIETMLSYANESV